MKTLVIGNSHTAAVIKARKQSPREEDLRILGLGGNFLVPNLLLNERCELTSEREDVLQIIEEQGFKGVSLNGFDLLIVYGCQLRAAGSGERWISKVSDPIAGFSRQVRQAAMRDYVHDTTHYRFLCRLAQAGLQERVQVVSMPSPMPNETASFCVDLPDIDKHYLAEISELMQAEIHALGFHYLDTPASLLADNGCTTRACYRSKRETDSAHLNVAGGQEVLSAIREHMRMLESLSAAA